VSLLTSYDLSGQSQTLHFQRFGILFYISVASLEAAWDMIVNRPIRSISQLDLDLWETCQQPIQNPCDDSSTDCSYEVNPDLRRSHYAARLEVHLEKFHAEYSLVEQSVPINTTTGDVP
jgi:hypothetical protein